MSWETWMNSNQWLPDWDIKSNPSQASFSSLRYQLGFATYSAASACSATPAYREICSKSMSNMIDRMIDRQVWHAIADEQWGPKSYNRGECATPNAPDSKWAQAETWPDPVIFQNIMYSGHLAQMIVLFEAVTGNMTYSINGWHFIYNDTSTPIHYNTEKLLDALSIQQTNPNNKQGGIPCEPYKVFTECNQNPNVALRSYVNSHKPNENYSYGTDKFAKYLVNECPLNYSGILEGWVHGIYLQDKETYFINDQGDGNWSEQHWNCGYNNGQTGFGSGLPNVPPRDIWVATFAYLWLNQNEIDQFVCNNGLIIVFNDRLWHYSPPNEYDGWVLRNNVDLGIGFGTSFYSIGAKQCLWFNERAGYNITEIEDRINGSINYLINRWGSTVNNSYGIKAPLLQTKGCDNGFGAPILDTANILTSMTLNNDSWRKVHNSKWPVMQTSLELLSVDYPNIMVRSARVLQNGLLQFEIAVAVPKNIINGETKMIVKLNGNGNNLQKVTMNGNDLPENQYTVSGNMLTINA
eukprot:742720_1